MNTREEFECIAARLKAVADKDRLRIVTLLLAGPEHVGGITAELNDDIARISHHLGVLREAGIVMATKHGRYVEYALHPDVCLPNADPLAERIFKLGGCDLAFPPLTATAATERVRGNNLP